MAHDNWTYDDIMMTTGELSGNPRIQIYPPVNASEEDLQLHIQNLRNAFKFTATEVTPEREKEIEDTHNQVLRDILCTLDGNDYNELYFLRRYIQGNWLVKRSPEDRLKFINSLIDWANDPVSYESLYKKKKERLESLKSEIMCLEKDIKEIEPT